MKNDNPFIESQKIAKKFDDATLKKDIDKLSELILSTERDLDDKDIFLRHKCIILLLRQQIQFQD